MKVPGPRRQRRDLRAGVGWWWWAVARIHASPGPLLITDPAPRDILPRGGALSKQPWFPKGVYPKAIQLLYSEPAFSQLLVPGPQLRSKWVEPSGGLNSPPREQDLSRDQESDAQPAEPPRPPPPERNSRSTEPMCARPLPGPRCSVPRWAALPRHLPAACRWQTCHPGRSREMPTRHTLLHLMGRL